MFKQGLNPQKLKIKHILGCQNESPDYPDTTDILYFLVESSNLKANKEAHLYSDDVISRKFDISQERARHLMDVLVEQNLLVYVKDTNIKRVYELKENPFL
jgi:hypothetical protein